MTPIDDNPDVEIDEQSPDSSTSFEDEKEEVDEDEDEFIDDDDDDDDDEDSPDEVRTNQTGIPILDRDVISFHLAHERNNQHRPAA